MQVGSKIEQELEQMTFLCGIKNCESHAKLAFCFCFIPCYT